MTEAERKRRQREAKRQGQAAGAPPDEPERPAEPERPPLAAADQTALMKQLTKERDHARQERNELRRELNLVTEQRDDALKGIMPPPDVVGDHIQMCWCSFCAKPRDRVKRMIVGSIRQRLFICSECVDRCTEILAK